MKYFQEFANDTGFFLAIIADSILGFSLSVFLNNEYKVSFCEDLLTQYIQYLKNSDVYMSRVIPFGAPEKFCTRDPETFAATQKV